MNSGGGWNIKMKSRLRLKLCELARGSKMKSRLRLKVCELRQGEWNLKMKKICKARQRGVQFRDEI